VLKPCLRYYTPPLDQLAPVSKFQYLAPTVGLEPTTTRLRALCSTGFPEAPRPVYKRGRGVAHFEFYPSALRENPSRFFHLLAARPPSLLLFAGDLARVKQTAHRRRRYVAMPTSSSAAATPPADASFEETLSTVAAEELRVGDTVDFGVSRMSSVRVQDMQRLGYFGAHRSCYEKTTRDGTQES
jgi:hypothetical protein